MLRTPADDLSAHADCATWICEGTRARRYILPAHELRRMVGEARALNETFAVEYTRLGPDFDPDDVHAAHGQRVRIDVSAAGGALRCRLLPPKKRAGVVTSLMEATGWGAAAACDPREPLLKPPPPSVRGARGTPLERLHLMFVTDFFWCYPVLREERALQFGYCQGE